MKIRNVECLAVITCMLVHFVSSKVFTLIPTQFLSEKSNWALEDRPCAGRV